MYRGDAKLVVIIGIDGSGKTTVAEEVAAGLAAGGLRAEVVWARWRPRLLQPARALARFLTLGRRSHAVGKEEPEALTQLKHRAFGRWRWLGLTYLVLGLGDYWLQYRRVLRQALRVSDVVLLDRYWYDLIIDAVGNMSASRSRATDLISGPWRRWFPRPDVVILLDVDEHSAWRRKGGENPVSYLRERRELYARVGAALGSVTVDAARPLKDVVEAVAAVVRGLAP